LNIVALQELAESRSLKVSSPAAFAENEPAASPRTGESDARYSQLQLFLFIVNWLSRTKEANASDSPKRSFGPSSGGSTTDVNVR